MSLSRVFYEPFYSLSDFDRLFDEAFNARTDNTRTRGQVTEGNESNGTRRLALRPKYVYNPFMHPFFELTLCYIGLMSMRTHHPTP